LLSIVASVILQIYYLRDIAPPALAFSQIIKPGLAVIVMLLGLKLTSAWPLISQAILAAGIYMAAYLMLKPFDVEDRRLLHCLGRTTAAA
jgi:hypothetical protein